MVAWLLGASTSLLGSAYFPSDRVSSRSCSRRTPPPATSRSPRFWAPGQGPRRHRPHQPPPRCSGVFLVEMLLVEVASPAMRRQRDPDLYDVPLLTFER